MPFSSRSLRVKNVSSIWFRYTIFGALNDLLTLLKIFILDFSDISEVKHDVYGKRQTAKIILILLTFSLALK